MTATTRFGEFTAVRPTLLLAFELGRQHWTVACMSTAGMRVRKRDLPAADLPRVLREIAEAKRRFGLAADAPVVSCYEAGREGFWLHRWLETQGVTNLVVDSSSIEVPRRARRAKTDALDVMGLLRLLRRQGAGDRRVWSVVAVPSVEAEDRRQVDRELEAAKRARTRVRNRIQGLLAAQGLRIRLTRHLRDALAAARTGDGRPIPANLQARLARDLAELGTIEARIRAVAAARRAQLPASPAAQRLQQLRGIAENAAARFSAELFDWRTFTSGRQVGALLGLTPTPYRSGDRAREQGIGKAGNRRVRTMAIEIAWSWMRFQPQSALAGWYRRRFADGGARHRRIGIVALARKLVIALWRYVAFGRLPEGAVLKAAG